MVFLGKLFHLRALGPLVLALLLAPAARGQGDEGATAKAGFQEAGFQEASAPVPGPLRFAPGAEVPDLLIPRDERLEYKAYLDLGIISSQVGTVVQTCTVAEQKPSILMTRPGTSLGETGSIRLFASGSYFLYSLESTLETRLLPQEWPRLSYYSESKTSKTRRREVLVGIRDGKPTSSYRGETTKGVPNGARRWRPERLRSVPEGTLDMLSAVFQARALVREQRDELVFPLIDTDKLWQLKLQRGEERRMELGEGKIFDVVEIVLSPGPYPGEPFENKERFKGVFGIQGSMHLWVEKHTGIAVRIQGTVPVGDEDSLFQIGVDVVLSSYSGTPKEFAPVEAGKTDASDK